MTAAAQSNQTYSELLPLTRVPDEALNISLKLETNESVTLNSVLEKIVGIILFVYPKARTPGCTRQACGFRDIYKLASDHQFKIYGLSNDKPPLQLKWKQEQNLPYHLICEGEQIIKLLCCLRKQSISRSVMVILQNKQIELFKTAISPEESVKTVRIYLESLKIKKKNNLKQQQPSLSLANINEKKINTEKNMNSDAKPKKNDLNNSTTEAEKPNKKEKSIRSNISNKRYRSCPPITRKTTRITDEKLSKLKKNDVLKTNDKVQLEDKIRKTKNNKTEEKAPSRENKMEKTENKIKQTEDKIKQTEDKIKKTEDKIKKTEDKIKTEDKMITEDKMKTENQAKADDKMENKNQQVKQHQKISSNQNNKKLKKKIQ